MGKALEDVQALYTQEHPDVTFADTQYKGSGELNSMLEAGSYADIEITASKGTMDTAVEKGYVDSETRFDMFKNDLVIVAAQDSPIDALSLQDVATSQYIVAVGDDSVPAGNYANQALSTVGCFKDPDGKVGKESAGKANGTPAYAGTPLEGRVVAQSSAGNVCKLAQSGEAQVAFVYSSDVYRFGGVKIVGVVPEETHKPIVYPAAICNQSKNVQEASAFLEWAVTDEKALQVWGEWGFNREQGAAVAAGAANAKQGSAQASDGLSEVSSFLANLDWSPLWVTLKTTGVAIVIVFILGLAAAYFLLRMSPKAQGIFDSIFTIPMVLPPTVCGFVLLYLCGSKTPFGQFFIDIGFPLIFSWPATVIAATVVAFPLMYRSARGAFEALDPNMLDAARTLGWSNARIFFRLMLPLSWSSIAAGTVLAFARALGEFGATLFLAGNYLGVTRTIPIAIYFEWMNGNDGIAWFWTAIIIAFSFVVILFINVWSNHTTKYRRGSKG